MIFKDIVAISRRENNLTLQEMAHKLNVHWTTLWRWEKGWCEPDIKEHWIKKIGEIS